MILAQLYKFFNSLEVAPGEYDREYQAADFADYFGSVLSSGLLHKDEIPGLEVSVEQGTMNTVISAGKAIISGHLYDNTSNHTLIHDVAEPSQNRIDRIVLRLDLRTEQRNILLHVKKGSPSSSPVPPELQRDNYIYELSLAQVIVRANTGTLSQSDVTDERFDDEVCGLTHSLLSGVPQSLYSNAIEEIGENANGTYVRWRNGLQMCWKEVRPDFSIETGDIRQSYTFPKPFITAPTASLSFTNTAVFDFYELYAGVTAGTDNNSWYLFSMTRTDFFLGDYPIRISAMGMWK